MSSRVGYQIPNFSYPGGDPRAIFPTVQQQAREAEAAGFDCVFVMDHFYQLPGIGTPDEPMLGAYTTLGALAASTERIQLSTPVVRQQLSQSDVACQGRHDPRSRQRRGVLALGAGWFQLEHDQLGFDFGTFTDPFEKLDEALQIIAPMLHGERPTLSGKHYRAVTAMNEPRVRDDMPIMLGGSGEKKTFRLAAKYADHLNIICDPALIPAKLEALAARCAENGRDLATLETSFLAFVLMDEDGDAARALQRTLMLKSGVDIDTLDATTRAAITARQFVGTPEEVAADIKARVIDAGIPGIVLNMIGNGHVPGVVTMAAEALRPLMH